MYAIRTRSGTVYMQVKRNFGDMSALEVRAPPLLQRPAAAAARLLAGMPAPRPAVAAAASRS
jgi:hypothetical protein